MGRLNCFPSPFGGNIIVMDELREVGSDSDLAPIRRKTHFRAVNRRASDIFISIPSYGLVEVHIHSTTAIGGISYRPSRRMLDDASRLRTNQTRAHHKTETHHLRPPPGFQLSSSYFYPLHKPQLLPQTHTLWVPELHLMVTPSPWKLAAPGKLSLILFSLRLLCSALRLSFPLPTRVL